MISNEAQSEYRAWLSVIAEMKRVFHVDSAELNHSVSAPMFAAIRRWGEELAELRFAQDTKVVIKALEEAREQYPNLVEET